MKEELSSDCHAQKLSLLYKEWCEGDVSGIERLAGAGSGRVYYRITGKEGICIGTVSENIKDSEAFIKLSRLFRTNGVSVPEVYIVSEDKVYYLQEDLGSTSLMDFIIKVKKEGKGEDELKEKVRRSIDGLVKIQNIDIKKIRNCVEYPRFSRRQVMWDLNYFKYEYLKPGGFEFDENALEDDFQSFADEILKMSKEDEGFMYRDFQSRNIILKDNEPCFIDFQGGRIGPRIYDLVSFLWQAKAGFSKNFREEMISYYKEKTKGFIGTIPYDVEYQNYVLKFALFRTLQVLGAYGLRGLVERKAHFIESIPAVLENLSELLAIGVADCYPTLKRVAEMVCNDPRFAPFEPQGLTITVYSFSYKKGYPADFTGNGGGFMFDCRGMHNPGRYDEYKPLTGRDKPVVDFLEERGEVQGFCAKVIELVSPSVECYLRRGFSNLQIGFGCTGGRHRSVYCAERVSRELAEKFPDAHVKLIHREQDIVIKLK